MGRDQVSLSRPTSLMLAGKQTEPVKTLVTDEFKTQITAFWKSRGYSSEGDFLRELLYVTVHGPQYLTDLHRQRIESLVPLRTGIGTEEAR